MSEPFLGEIKMFAGNYAPRGYALCDGQLLAISQNDALFSLFGTTYGGDGRTTFGLPGLRGRIPIHQGSGPGLSNRRLGSKGGAENVTLLEAQLPSHNHQLQGATTGALGVDPAGALPGSTSGDLYNESDPPNIDFAPAAVLATTGGTTQHTNLMPTLCINYIVALVGIYPSRN